MHLTSAVRTQLWRMLLELALRCVYSVTDRAVLPFEQAQEFQIGSWSESHVTTDGESLSAGARDHMFVTV
jgi:hypothetical protein